MQQRQDKNDKSTVPEPRLPLGPDESKPRPDNRPDEPERPDKPSEPVTEPPGDKPAHRPK